VYALDLGSDSKAVVKVTSAGRIHGSAGPAIGNDGTVYAHAGDRIIALTAKTLKEKDHFSIPAPASTGMTPLVFQHNGKDIVVAGAGSEVYLLDSGALGGQDHSTPFAHARLRGCPGGFCRLGRSRNTLTVDLRPRFGRGLHVWRDCRVHARGARRPSDARAALDVTRHDRACRTGDRERPGVRAFDRREEQREAICAGRCEWKRTIYEPRQCDRAANADTGLAVANGQVYFSTQDNTVYCFGIPTEH
jgi:outer membrane protein assembly factor BamB